MRKPFLAFLIVALAAKAANAQTIPVIQLINNAGMALAPTLSGGSNFVTNFKATNDVTISLLAGEALANYLDVFGGSYASGNPSYITNYVGAASNATGNGASGDLTDIQTSGGVSFQFVFAIPFAPGDVLFLIDCDTTEQYKVQAFSRSGTNFIAASTAGWTAQDFPGSTLEVPSSNFPSWNSTNGILSSPAGGGTMNEPLTVIAPDRPVDRVIVSQIAGGSEGSPVNNAAIQFLHVNLGSLALTLKGANGVLSVPFTTFPVIVQSATNLSAPVWTPFATNTGPTNLSVKVSKKPQQFFRLFYAP